MNAQAKQIVATPVDQLPVAPAASESAAILSVIERMALNSEIDPERIERFIVLKERIDANMAKKAFDAAVAEAKATIPPAEKNATGHNNKRYADFYAYAKVVDPIISALGLSYRFRTVQTDRITVTCVLTHEGGHSEENSLSGPPDASGSKNAIQAIGSTLTYLQRYTLVQALGLAASNDDDGQASGMGELVSMEQIEQLQSLLTETNSDVAKFCQVMKVESLAGIPAAKFSDAIAKLNAKKQRAVQ
jgi:hypothetical protein